jgi:hypothetical protein
LAHCPTPARFQMLVSTLPPLAPARLDHRERIFLNKFSIEQRLNWLQAFATSGAREQRDHAAKIREIFVLARFPFDRTIWLPSPSPLTPQGFCSGRARGYAGREHLHRSPPRAKRGRMTLHPTP